MNTKPQCDWGHKYCDIYHIATFHSKSDRCKDNERCAIFDSFSEFYKLAARSSHVNCFELVDKTIKTHMKNFRHNNTGNWNSTCKAIINIQHAEINETFECGLPSLQYSALCKLCFSSMN